LSKTPNDCALRAQNRNARAGKKEGGWGGEGIPCRSTGQAFARPRFPPPNFVPVENWRAAFIVSLQILFFGGKS